MLAGLDIDFLEPSDLDSGSFETLTMTIKLYFQCYILDKLEVQVEVMSRCNCF